MIIPDNQDFLRFVTFLCSQFSSLTTHYAFLPYLSLAMYISNALHVLRALVLYNDYHIL